MRSSQSWNTRFCEGRRESGKRLRRWKHFVQLFLVVADVHRHKGDIAGIRRGVRKKNRQLRPKAVESRLNAVKDYGDGIICPKIKSDRNLAHLAEPGRKSHCTPSGPSALRLQRSSRRFFTTSTARYMGNVLAQVPNSHAIRRHADLQGACRVDHPSASRSAYARASALQLHGVGGASRLVAPHPAAAAGRRVGIRSRSAAAAKKYRAQARRPGLTPSISEARPGARQNTAEHGGRGDHAHVRTTTSQFQATRQRPRRYQRNDHRFPAAIRDGPIGGATTSRICYFKQRRGEEASCTRVIAFGRNCRQRR